MLLFWEGSRSKQLDVLTLYGLVAVSLMMLFYALEGRSNWFVLAFAASCILASIYGFLQGAWPFGIVELVWSGVALKRFMNLRKDRRKVV